VARRHYLQVTEEHCQKATSNPTSHMHAEGRTEPRAKKETAVSPAIAKDTAVQIPPRGVEETPFHAENNGVEGDGDTISDTACPCRSPLHDSTPNNALDGLPAAVRDQLRELSPEMAAKIQQLLLSMESEQRGR
jgi:hypothetical protein